MTKKQQNKNDHQLMWTFVVLVASLAAALVQIRSPRAAQVQTLQRLPSAITTGASPAPLLDPATTFDASPPHPSFSNHP